LVGLSPGLNPINKKYHFWEIFRKSKKIFNGPFLPERSDKLLSWCFGSASLLEVKKCSLKLFHMNSLKILFGNFSNLKICQELWEFFWLFLLVGPSPALFFPRKVPV
jgi:hypothetical protein